MESCPRGTLPTDLQSAYCKVWWRRDNGLGFGLGPLVLNDTGLEDILVNMDAANFVATVWNDCAPVHKARAINT